MTERDKRERVVDARMKLKARFEAEMARTPGMSDRAPLGSGPPNRHGMPRLPPGQTETKKWPVLDLGEQPRVTRESFRLIIDGACAAPRTLAWDDLMRFEQVRDRSDFHCVTTWSKFDIEWVGVRVRDLLESALPNDDAGFVMCHGSDGYTTNVSLAECWKPDVLLVHTADGRPLPPEHGGPLRMITPQLYAWKGAKWIARLELMAEDRPGFWEQQGYSNTAHPWREDRYG